MAVANTFTFGGVSTSAYGLVVEGPGDYSAPKRAVDTIEIPGRNGAFQLDKGYYENIELEYKVVVKEATQDDFLDSIDAFRNAIVSQIGYQRLEDTYHPGEYRMAMYSGGLDEDPQFHGNGAVFKVNFDCKPQRFLTSGTTSVTVHSGDTLTNPTLFEASPMLAVKGYGNIGFNGYNVEIYNSIIGPVEVSQAIEETKKGYDDINRTVTILLKNTDLLNTGDIIHLSGIKETLVENVGNYNDMSVSFQSRVGITATRQVSKPNVTFSISYDAVDLVYGTASSWDTELVAEISASGGGVSETVSVYTEFVYNGGNSLSLTFNQYSYKDTQSIIIPVFIADSTVSTLGDPTYIDLDLGEAYMVSGGTLIALNNVVELGADLPKLGVGNNTVTFDNTVTDLKVTPRWWKI